MNKIHALLSALLVSFSYTYAQERIEVHGKIDGIDSGRLLILAQVAENKVDTLGSALFTAPDFSVTGVVKEPTVARLVVEGYHGGFEFIAEPGATYTALLKDDDGAYIRGGDLQDKWLGFQAWMKESQDSINTVQQRYNDLMSQSRFRSASRVNDTLTLLQNKQVERSDLFIKENNENIIAAYVAQTTAQGRDLSLKESQALYASLGSSARMSVSGRIMQERITRLSKTTMGQMAPDFTMPTPEGDLLTLSKIPGKLKILDFWASWCGPCRLNNQTLKELYAKYRSHGLEIVAVSMDDSKQKWINAIEKDQLPWIHISDLKAWEGEVAKLYDITGIPALFILDEKNQIIGRDMKGTALTNFIVEQFNKLETH